MATENLFLLEFLVDSVQLDPECECQAPPGQTCVSFEFLGNPPLEVCEADFSPGIKYGRDNAAYKSGKSCLFSLTPEQVMKAITQFDVNVTILKKMQPGWLPEKIEIGSSLISIANLFNEMLQSVSDPASETPTSKTLKDVFDVLANDGSPVGKIGVYIRMSCFGRLIVTQFQMNFNDKSVLFKDKDGKSLYRYKKAPKGRESNIDALPNDTGGCPPSCPTKSKPQGHHQSSAPSPFAGGTCPFTEQCVMTASVPGDPFAGNISGNQNCANACPGVEGGPDGGQMGQMECCMNPDMMYSMQQMCCMDQGPLCPIPPKNPMCPMAGPTCPAAPPPCLECLSTPPPPCIPKPCEPPPCGMPCGMPCGPPGCGMPCGMPCGAPPCGLPCGVPPCGVPPCGLPCGAPPCGPATCPPCSPCNPCGPCGPCAEPPGKPDPPGNYQEIGASMGGNSLTIRVHKDKAKIEPVNDADVSDGGGRAAGGGGCCPPCPKTKPKHQVFQMGPGGGQDGSPNLPFCFKMGSSGTGGSCSNNVSVQPPVGNTPCGGAFTEIADPNKEVFILRIGKKSEGADKKSNLELELCTPRGPELKPLPRKETRDTQVYPTDVPPDEGGTAKGGKGGKDKGKKGGKKKK